MTPLQTLINNHSKALILLLALFSTHLYAQNHEFGDDYQNITGTKVFMKTPTGFEPIDGVTAFQKGDAASIYVNDLIGGNFYSNGRNYTKENFEARGVSVLKFEEMEIDGYPARFALLQPNLLTLSYGVIFGDSSFSVLVSANCASLDIKTQKEFENAIFTMRYKKDFEFDPFHNAFFSFDNTQSKLKFEAYSGGMYVYLREESYKGDSLASMLNVVPLPIGPEDTAETLLNNALQNFDVEMRKQEQPIPNLKVVGFETEPLNGYSSKTALIVGGEGGKSQYFYFQVIVYQDKALLINGIPTSKACISDFKELLSTLKFK